MAVLRSKDLKIIKYVFRKVFQESNLMFTNIMCKDDHEDKNIPSDLNAQQQKERKRKKGRRKEEDNPWGLSITHTGFYVYVSLEILIHSRHFTFFFFPGTLCLILNSLNLFLDCKFVALYVYFYFAWKVHQRLLSSSA